MKGGFRLIFKWKENLMATKDFNNNNISIALDTGEGHQYDRKEVYQYDKRVECGRSMVEMLGTLAIIGVLSIGGIAGYSYGMDKWRATETINDVNLRMIDIMTRVSQGHEVLEISSDFEDTGRSGYVIDLFPNNGEPSIMVEKVPTSVCKMILQNTPDTQDIFVGNLSADAERVDGYWYLGDNEDICNDGKKEMLFALDESILADLGYTTDPESTATVLECYSNADCRPNAPYCENGTCIQCSQDSHCPSHSPICDTTTGQCLECTSHSHCPSELRCDITIHQCVALNACETPASEDFCYPCDYPDPIPLPAGSVSKCLNRFSADPGGVGRYWTSYPCDYENDSVALWGVPSDSCLACSNRTIEVDSNGVNYCVVK